MTWTHTAIFRCPRRGSGGSLQHSPSPQGSTFFESCSNGNFHGTAWRVSAEFSVDAVQDLLRIMFGWRFSGYDMDTYRNIRCPRRAVEGLCNILRPRRAVHASNHVWIEIFGLPHAQIPQYFLCIQCSAFFESSLDGDSPGIAWRFHRNRKVYCNKRVHRNRKVHHNRWLHRNGKRIPWEEITLRRVS